MGVVTELRARWRLQREANVSRVSVMEEIRSDTRFRTGLDELAERLGRDRAAVTDDAARYLDEMVAVNSDALPDFNLVLSKIWDRRGFEGVVQYDDAAVDRLRPLDDVSPLVMMTGHRSYADFVVRLPFARRGFEREFRFAGANVAFWPMRGIGHSGGLIYIRRGFRDPVYAFVLRQYVGWLTEHRSNFTWAIEGGRTRTGKLLAPKTGLLAYVADAYVDGRTSDVTLVPATVVYEYLDEVFEYARYGRGAPKAGESPLHAVRLVRNQRRVSSEARISVGIGEPVSLADFVDRDAQDEPERFSASITRAAVEVCRRIDAATPITAVALVLLPLLERDDVHLTVDELVRDLAPTLEYIARRQLPAFGPRPDTAAGVRRALELLAAQALVTTGGNGDGRRYAVTPGRHIEAAYYRNAIVHYFAVRSISEVALVRCTTAEPGDRVNAFWREVDRLRDLLDHEFFFPEGDAFGASVAGELSLYAPDWEPMLESEPHAVLDALRPFFAPRALAPFLEAYRVIADALRRLGSEPVVDERRLMLDALARAQLEVALRRLQRPDAASLNMFDTPLAAARARGLMHDPPANGRDVFADAVQASLDAIAALET